MKNFFIIFFLLKIILPIIYKIKTNIYHLYLSKFIFFLFSKMSTLFPIFYHFFLFDEINHITCKFSLEIFTYVFMTNFCMIAILANLFNLFSCEGEESYKLISQIRFRRRSSPANIGKLRPSLLHTYMQYSHKHIQMQCRGGSGKRISLPYQSSFREHFRRVLQNC